MPRPVHFEYPVEDPDRAMKFYSDVFEWSFQTWGEGSEPYYMTTTGPAGTPGIDGGLMRPMPGSPPKTPVLTMAVSDVNEYVAKVTAAGGKALMAPFPVPGVGHMCYATDTEGIMFGMMQMDPTAGS